MTAQFTFSAPGLARGDPTVVRDHYQRGVEDLLRTVWAGRRRVGSCLGAALLLGLGVLAYIGPRYTAEAMINLNFSREEPTATIRATNIAAMDASSVVESAVRLMRSRPLANAVVARLELDRTPEPHSLIGRLLSEAKAAVGMHADETAAREHAVSRLLGQVRVTSELRSYLITIAATDSDPERAGRLANAVAAEYLRVQAVQQVAESRAAAERELSVLSAVYGPRHPSYLETRAKVAMLGERLRILREASTGDEGLQGVIGQSLLPAQKVTVPSGPSLALVLGIAALAGLAAGIGVALRLDRRLLERVLGRRSPGPARV